MNISKELFIETINFIKERNDAQNKIDKIFREEFTDGLFWPYCRYETQIVKILEEIMGDKECQWISYYCWEKDFGRDKHLGNPTDRNGNEIPLTTPEDLWNLLISNEKDS